MADEAKTTAGVDIQVLAPGSVTTFDANGVTSYPASPPPPPPGSLPGGAAAPSWAAPSWPFMVPQSPMVIVIKDTKKDEKPPKRPSEVFKRP